MYTQQQGWSKKEFGVVFMAVSGVILTLAACLLVLLYCGPRAIVAESEQTWSNAFKIIVLFLLCEVCCLLIWYGWEIRHRMKKMERNLRAEHDDVGKILGIAFDSQVPLLNAQRELCLVPDERTEIVTLEEDDTKIIVPVQGVIVWLSNGPAPQALYSFFDRDGDIIESYCLDD